MADVPRFERKTAFRVNKPGSVQAVASGAEATVDFTGTIYDLGGNFDLAANAYVTPLNGIYAFTWSVETLAQGNGAGRVLTRLRANGTEIARGYDFTVRDFVTGDDNVWIGASQVLLNANDSVVVTLLVVSGPAQNIFAGVNGCSFTGYRIQSESRTILGG